MRTRLFAFVMIFLSTFLLCERLYADEIQGEAVRSYVAGREGVPAENLEVGYQEFFPLPLTGGGYYYSKVIDRITGKDYEVVLDPDGNVVDRVNLLAAERVAFRAKYGKLHPSLYHTLETKGPSEMVSVSIWLDMGGQTAAVERPDRGKATALTMADVDRLSQEGFDRSRKIHAGVQKPVIDFLKAKGFDAAGSELSPLVTVDIPVFLIEELALMPIVDTIDLVVEGGPEGGRDQIFYPTGGPEAYSARRTEKADVVQGRGISGDGYKLAVVEGDGVSDLNSYLDNTTHNVAYYNSATKNIDDHATAVGGFIASTHSTVRGTAPGIDTILSANSDGWDLADYQASTSWALGQSAEALNNSYYLEIDGAMHNSDRWADYLVRNSGVFFVKSAGNRGESDGYITSPGLGYNIITVGSIDDLNNNDWSDDQMSGLSSYIEPSGREKPEVAAVGCGQWNPGDPTTGMDGTTIASPWTGNVGCGTSYAAPAVTGLMATLMQRDSWLAMWPETAKATVIASALHNIEGSTSRSEYDGGGAIDMAAADYIAANGWYDGRYINGGDFTNQRINVASIQLYAGEVLRAVLAYDSNPASNYTTDPLEGDLDLRLYDASNNLVTWTSTSDSWEIMEWTVTSTGTYTLDVYNYANSLAAGESTYIGTAWWPGHYALDTSIIQNRGTPTTAQDHYKADASTTTDWLAVAMRSPSAADYDILLYDNSRYGNPVDFVSLASSWAYPVDVVVIDRNHAPSKSYYPIVDTYSGTGNYDIQRAISGGAISSGSVTQTTTASFVSKVWDIPMTAGVPTYISVVPSSGNANLGMLLFDSDPLSSTTWYRGRSSRVADSDVAGSGGSEYISYTPAASDTLGLVVFNNLGQTTNTTWTLYVDTSAPTGSISINSGAAYTTTTSVTLTLSASDPDTAISQMRFSNDGTTWSAWETYGTSKAWTLTSGDGTKTVYVQFKNKAGQSSSLFTDTIILDVTAPTGSISINSAAAYTTSTSATLTLTCKDTVSGCYQMRFSNDNATWSAWEANAASKAWTLTSGEGTKTVYVQYKNNAGLSSVSYSDTIILDVSAPTGTISINGGAAYATSTSATLTLTCTDAVSGCYQMRFSNDNATWSAWEANAASKAWTLASGDGTKTVYVQYKNNAGLSSVSYSDTIILDATAPTGTISINGGATYTISMYATLTLSCTDAVSGCYQMRFSNDNATWSAWEANAASKAWDLTGGEGTKTVYVQYKNNAGLSSVSYSDTIVLDTTAPTGTISINGGAAYTTSTSVTLTLSCTDAVSGCYQMRFSNDNATWSAWEANAASKAWDLTGGEGTKTVYVQYKNNAGLSSGSFSDTIVLDTTAPTGTISINGGAAYTTSTSVTLTLSCTDAVSGCYQMRFSNDNATWSAWEANAASKAWTLSSGEGTKTAYVQYKNNAGLASGSFSDTIILDATAPTGTISINGGAATTNTTAVTLTLSCTDVGSGCYQMRFSNDNAAWSAWEANAASKAWTLTSGDGTKTVYVQYKDNAGNASGSFFDDIILQTLPNVSVTLVPDSTSVPRGGTLGYTVTVTNNTSSSQTFQYWTYVTLPNGSRYPATGELFGPVSVTLTAGQVKSAHLTHGIPAAAPLGTYTYYGNVGPYPIVWDSDSFFFTVTSTLAPQGETREKWDLLENGLTK